jgi:hypothetical protein
MALKKIFEDLSGASNDIETLRNILDEIIELMEEANSLVSSVSRDTDPIIYERWKAYPYGHIMTSLGSGGYGSRYDTSFDDIIDELEKASKGEEHL